MERDILDIKFIYKDFNDFLNLVCSKNNIDIVNNNKEFNNLLEGFSKDENCKYQIESTILLHILNETKLIEELVKIIELVKINCNISFDEASSIVNVISDVIKLNSHTMFKEMDTKRAMLTKNFDEILKLAEKGDAEAQYVLGEFYYDGINVKKDLDEAVKYFTESMKNGYIDSISALGVCYYYNNSMNLGIKKAVKLFLQAAEMNEPRAQMFLGMCYKDGIGIEKNIKKSNEFYNKAIEGYTTRCNKGDPFAQYRLGLLYYYGDGVELNIDLAKKLFTDAAEQGYKPAIDILVISYMINDFSKSTKFENNITIYNNTNTILKNEKEIVLNENNQVKQYIKSKEIGSSTDKVVKIKEISKDDLYRIAKQGVAEAQLEYGMKCTNHAEAIEWITNAAKQGLGEAQFQLGNRYKTGIGITKNIDNAMLWYKKAADQGHEIAIIRLKEIEKNKYKYMSTNSQPEVVKRTVISQNANKIMDSNSLKKLSKLSELELKMLVEQGSAEAQYYFGLNCKDSSEALKWIASAAEMGLAEAQFNLGNKYRMGISVKKDIEKAKELFSKASNQGHKNSLIKLQEINGEKVYNSSSYTKSDRVNSSNSQILIDKKVSQASAINKKLVEKFKDIFGYEPGDDYNLRVSNAREIICQGRYKKGDMIEIVDTSISSNGKSGLVLTIDSICLKDSANVTSKFIAKYEDINYTYINESKFLGMNISTLELNMKFGTTYKISIDAINKAKLKDFIDYAISIY